MYVFEDFPEAKIFGFLLMLGRIPGTCNFIQVLSGEKLLVRTDIMYRVAGKKKGSPCLPFASAFGRCQLVLTAANCFIDLHGF